MISSDFIHPGDKIDITYLHQKNGKVYKSGVLDVLDDSVIEVSMPTEGGKMVLFQVGFECSLFFYGKKGLYICEGQVLDRYKRGGLYMMSIKFTSTPKKYQRREFYRVETSVNFFYYKISEEVAKLETTEDLFEEIADPKYISEKKIALTQDISGGGIRFITDEKLELNSNVLIVIRLSNEKVDQTLYLVTEIISSNPIEKIPGKQMVRARFQFKNNKDREIIVRYVFEEDRMLRKKENGD